MNSLMNLAGLFALIACVICMGGAITHDQDLMIAACMVMTLAAVFGWISVIFRKK